MSKTLDVINREVTEKAVRRRTKPAVFTVAQLQHALNNQGHGLAIPSVGSKAPDGWTDLLAKDRRWWFVALLGFDGDGGMAMSQRTMIRRMIDHVLLHPTHGFAVVDHGRFQIHVSVFRETIVGPRGVKRKRMPPGEELRCCSCGESVSLPSAMYAYFADGDWVCSASVCHDRVRGDFDRPGPG